MLSSISTNKRVRINTPAGDIDTKIADNFFSRLKGLLGTKELRVGEGLLLMDCNAVHTFWMQYAIDIVFLDADYKVLKIGTNIVPGKAVFCKAAVHTLELTAAQTTELGLKKNMVLLVDNYFDG